MPGAVLTLLAHIEKRDLAAVAEPVPHGRDIDLGGVRHVRFLKARGDAPETASAYPRLRTRRPGRAPVSWPFSKIGVPATSVAR